MIELLSFPSDLYRGYIVKLQEICYSAGLSLSVKGSLAKLVESSKGMVISNSNDYQREEVDEVLISG